MRDGKIKRAIKFVARRCYFADLFVTRALLRWRLGAPAFRLEGECNGCGKCCEAPSIQARAVVYHSKLLRKLALAWHSRINGFELIGTDDKHRALIFRCSHFDAAIGACDSYESRPGLCRDYPTNQATTPAPSLFAECSYEIVHRRAEGFRRALSRLDLPPAEREKLELALRVRAKTASGDSG